MLLDEIRSKPAVKQQIESFLPETGLENLDALISTVVYDKPFQAVVIIDELSEDLIKVLEKFSFPVERGAGSWFFLREFSVRKTYAPAASKWSRVTSP